MIIWIGICYIVIHLSVYTFLLRKTQLFRKELPIFLFHAVSYLSLALWFVSLGNINSEVEVVCWIGVICMHGIYSIIFLELWSLTEGGYSLSMLTRLQSVAPQVIDDFVKEMESVGVLKKENRLKSLRRLRVIEIKEDQYHLTKFGVLTVDLIQFILWLANIRRFG